MEYPFLRIPGEQGGELKVHVALVEGVETVEFIVTGSVTISRANYDKAVAWIKSNLDRSRRRTSIIN